MATRKPDTDAPEESQTLPPLDDGELATLAPVTVKEKKTRPPSHYTEGTLLDDMLGAAKFVENDPELKKMLKSVSGLGTSATRDSIIETLKAHKYVEKKGKFLVATDKGIAFIQWLERVMPELVDVALTARWEAELAVIEARGSSGKAFEERVAAQVRRMISIFQAAPSMRTSTPATTTEHSSMSDTTQPRSNKPTDKQLEFAKNIAKKLNLRVPDDVMTSFDACRAFIDEHLPAYNKPSEKQLSFAQNIAQRKGVAIPDEILANGRELSRWIDDNK